MSLVVVPWTSPLNNVLVGGWCIGLSSTKDNGRVRHSFVWEGWLLIASLPAAVIPKCFPRKSSSGRWRSLRSKHTAESCFERTESTQTHLPSAIAQNRPIPMEIPSKFKSLS
ncbi:hypothetical protein H310_12412 [Aphanomyces invadans]|uniref:Uncharacterized protein n=1 Tax=Aphanomyces invadans TaxID=157072 RepID=A0A024TJ43_9STRA|nr:hypothetical protein H310_12412 [Aphanomyces invadans]ETV93631.1 hypothetical protein H310_12412 [Aphanomyces invadans]|eukprot:XP_008877672.1 hypothetical protein H310_12412 [Aphanomyces invadans]